MGQLQGHTLPTHVDFNRGYPSMTSPYVVSGIEEQNTLGRHTTTQAGDISMDAIGPLSNDLDNASSSQTHRTALSWSITPE